MSIRFIAYLGWQNTYLLCGCIGIVASILGLIIISEPENSLAEKVKKENKKNKVVHNPNENIICKIMKNYASGFKAIFSNLAATLCILGIFSRIWETATSSQYMTKYYEIYTKYNPDH